jgi:hypothetical protein
MLHSCSTHLVAAEFMNMIRLSGSRRLQPGAATAGRWTVLNDLFRLAKTTVMSFMKMTIPKRIVT